MILRAFLLYACSANGYVQLDGPGRDVTFTALQPSLPSTTLLRRAGPTQNSAVLPDANAGVAPTQPDTTAVEPTSLGPQSSPPDAEVLVPHPHGKVCRSDAWPAGLHCMATDSRQFYLSCHYYPYYMVDGTLTAHVGRERSYRVEGECPTGTLCKALQPGTRARAWHPMQLRPPPEIACRKSSKRKWTATGRPRKKQDPDKRKRRRPGGRSATGDAGTDRPASTSATNPALEDDDDQISKTRSWQFGFMPEPTAPVHD